MDSEYIKVLDGGFSSQLSQHVNLDAEYANHPLWCARFLATDPDSIVKTHRDFIQAGADIVTTNTYQASVEGFQKYFKFSYHESYKLIKNAVVLAKDAISLENVRQPLGRRVHIAGSVGSYGACLHDGSEYHGNYMKYISAEFIKDWHRPRISALVESGVDFLAIETIPALSEAKIIMDLLLKEFPTQKAWLSFTCKNAEQTVAYDCITQAALRLQSLDENRQLIAIGVNCLNPSLVSPLLNGIRKAETKGSSIQTIAYPNSGEIYDIKRKKWMKSPESPSIHSYVSKWLHDGIHILGGCCRTNAQDIERFRKTIDSFNKANFATKNILP